MAGSAAPLVMNLASIGEAAASVATDYKALVCVFLSGGNDYANTLPPYDQATYDAYQSHRPNLAIARNDLAGTVLTPQQALPGGGQYALAPGLLPLLPLFNAGVMAPVLNVGTLSHPTTKAQYASGAALLPPKLFSHNDQSSYFQSSAGEGAPSGWGGRIGDLFEASNGTALLTCVNAAGNAIFLTGKTAVQYCVTTSGPVPLNYNDKDLMGSLTAGSVLRAMITAPRVHDLEDEYARITKRSLDTYTLVAAALAAAPAIQTVYPSGNMLADQLKSVARMISVSQELGLKRQVFFVTMPGFDTHDSLVKNHPVLLASVANAMKAFYDTTVELGVADKVTAFTGTDFGRALQNNVDGSDHGWGGVQWVVGGAVKGRQIYGKSPIFGNDGPDDVGQGRLLPSTSVEQYAATLAKWFGVSDSQMSLVLPSITNFDASTRDVGFMKAS